MKHLKLIILAIIVAILAGTGLATLLHSPAHLPALDAGDDAPMDADGRPRMRGLTYTHVENGVKKWSLKANGARYEESTGKVFLKEVKIKFFQDDGKAISLRSDQGVYQQKNQEVTLTGNVVGNTSDGTQLLTTVITYREKDKVADTDAEVTVQGARFKVQGKGMLVFVDQNKVILKSNIRSTFTPEGKGPPKGATKD